MLVTGENININFNSIPENEYWSIEDEKELKVHKIHAYPAKFPSFVIKKSIEYAQDAGIKLNIPKHKLILILLLINSHPK